MNVDGINGTFYAIGKKPIYGIAIQDGRPLEANSYVSNFEGLKRGTIWFDGNNISVGMLYNIRTEVHTAIRWAISGISLYPVWNTKKEGFIGPYMDVLRATAHTAIGFRGKKVYLIASDRKYTLEEFRNKILNSSIAFDGLIALDGGGSTQMRFKDKDIVKSVRRLNHCVRILNK